MIKIGITPSFMYPDSNRAVYGPKSLTYVENDMMTYIARKGILPVLLPDIDKPLLKDILDEMQGFILQGGVDLAPESYGEKPIGQWKGDKYRDDYELQIIDYAIKNDKPIFGICRGFQLMNVYFGGTLYQDTLTQKEGVNNHRSAELYDTIKHPLVIKESSFLASLYPNNSNPYVNTIHHQSVKELGTGLDVWATSDDGLVEAFGYNGKSEGMVMAVQWHPEFSKTLGSQILDPNPLYDTFLSHIK
ncbi:gamma-glutamyl-gamma-aminobutyrate hydrolase family protein [Flammeovirga kamogawensis]|uniref:Gamma-glutamyl-gamma-aminobutyrate hydrolase family protein n=1 Tax=Flammeovirga kamogawensis TaxID=373891 RepID=A0ABX8GZB3_9BACT|nr:gamma-glutamyl-gamma-aminobutyrate hydrolase family protein [Flammeovirga kamogawensis]MBB6458957.1 putative glutamine amidotransferase [Flammeovirga kamogawensis]QWG08532.1 gamma-glutamyl-gamma-aminobutyrate hydrolase family protein [Flammeovirga kamogawensis]TRX70097.1 gamma-glutamyl-gamma-aminobutyrate hydrolase family protein [Flammeovirga kamogawensis]